MSKPPQQSDLVSDLKPVLYVFGGGSLIFSLILLFFPLNYEYISNKKREDEKIEKDNQSILEMSSLLLVPRKSFWAPQLVFYLMIAGQIWLFYNHVPFVSPNAVEMLEAGGLRNDEFSNGEYWRLISSVFLHAGFYHLVYNLIGFFLITFCFTFHFSNRWYFAAFMVSGILSGAATLIFVPDAVAVGASGALMGLSGFILTVNFLLKELKENRPLIYIFLLPMVILTLFFGVINNANNVAHISGLLTGGILGFLYSLELRRNTFSF